MKEKSVEESFRPGRTVMMDAPSGTVTTSRVLMSGGTAEPERKLLLKWAEYAAANGGSFSVRQEWTENQWYTTWVINWPAGSADK